MSARLPIEGDILKKYSNLKETFTYAGDWICKAVDAIITEESGSEIKVSIRNKEKTYSFTKEVFFEHFSEVGEVSDDDLYEFNSKSTKIKKNEIVSLVKTHYSGEILDLFLLAIDKAYQDSFTSAGSTKCLTVTAFDDFKSGKLVKQGLNNIGDPIFNRSARWTPVADELAWANGEGPAPLGIRASDYAPLRDCNQIYRELLVQIFSMAHEGVIPIEIESYLGQKVIPGSHICFYCGLIVELSAFNEQAYGAKEHALNFCHRDPGEKLGRTRPGNVYFGHTSCNRTQGGLSELGRILDGLRLLNLHRDLYLDNKDVSQYIRALG